MHKVKGETQMYVVRFKMIGGKEILGDDPTKHRKVALIDVVSRLKLAFITEVTLVDTSKNTQKVYTKADLKELEEWIED
jgi:hypothetical protein